MVVVLVCVVVRLRMEVVIKVVKWEEGEERVLFMWFFGELFCCWYYDGIKKRICKWVLRKD